MAVHTSDRETAFTEFERWMAVIQRYTYDRLKAVPSRYEKFLSHKLHEPTNKAYTDVILANEQDVRTEGGAIKRAALFEDAIRQLQRLQKPLIAYWNIRQSKEKGMEQWVNMINREFKLIYAAMHKEGEPPVIYTLPNWEKIKRLAFLSKMSELHRYTYQKIGHAPNDCKDFISAQLAELVDNALYCVVMANRKEPATREEADRREELLEGSVQSINGMQRPLLALWNAVEYSENEMDAWAGLLNEELKILEGLKRADKARYKQLK